MFGFATQSNPFLLPSASIFLYTFCDARRNRQVKVCEGGCKEPTKQGVDPLSAPGAPIESVSSGSATARDLDLWAAEPMLATMPQPSAGERAQTGMDADAARYTSLGGTFLVETAGTTVAANSHNEEARLR